MNSYDFLIYEFICFMNSYMNSGVPSTFPDETVTVTVTSTELSQLPVNRSSRAIFISDLARALRTRSWVTIVIRSTELES